MNISKIKSFAKEHKDELITTAVIIGGTVLVVLGFKPFRRARTNKVKNIVIPDGFKAWNMCALWSEGGYLNAIIESIPVDNLGELGNQYIKNGFAQSGDIASIVIGIVQK